MSITLTGVTKRLDGGAASLSPGYYVIRNEANSTLRNIDNPSWTSTTKFNDVGVNDHTTYEEYSLGDNHNYVKALYVYASNVTIDSSTWSVFAESTSVVIYYSTDGTNWTLWAMPVAPANFSKIWSDGNANPTNQTARYVQLILDDGATSDPIPRSAIGDWRITVA